MFARMVCVTYLGRGRVVKGRFSHVIASQKVEKWRKSGYNPPKTGSGGRLTSMLFKGGVELIIKMHYPSGVTPGAASIPQPVNPWAASKVGRPDFYVVRSIFFKEKRDFEDAPKVMPEEERIFMINSTPP